jgi:hypothetical protein
MAVKLLALRAGRTLLPRKIPGTHFCYKPIAVAARSKARTVFARSNTAIVGWNPTGGMDVCVCSVCYYSVST